MGIGTTADVLGIVILIFGTIQRNNLIDRYRKTTFRTIISRISAILDIIAKDINRSFEYDVFPDILKRELPFFGYVMKDEYWLDIGTPASYLKAHHDFLGGRITGLDAETEAVSDVATRTEIDKLSVIGDGCTIKPGVRIVNSVIGPGVHIEEKAVIENSVIWSHTRIASAAEIRNAIIGRSCHIGRNSIIGEGSVLGDKTSLTDYTKV